MEEFQKDDEEFESCKSRSTATTTYTIFKEVTYHFLAYPDTFGCPFPCVQMRYEISLKYFHETSWPDINKPDNFSNTFFLSLFYGTFDMVEVEETLVYDVGNFFAAAGGYLGLFLGFSCLSLLMQIIECLGLYLSKT